MADGWELRITENRGELIYHDVPSKPSLTERVRANTIKALLRNEFIEEETGTIHGFGYSLGFLTPKGKLVREE